MIREQREQAFPRQPMRRLALAMVVAPLFLGGALTLGAFLLAGISTATQAEALAVTSDTAILVFTYLALFTPTVGAVGVGLLWALDQRGPLAWTLTGAIAGSLVAIIHGFTSALGLVDRTMVVFCGVLGWGLFLMIRWFAGIRR